MFNEAQLLVIDRAKHPRFSQLLSQANFSAAGANPVCGDEITITALIKDGLFEEISHHGRACTICQASADLLAEKIIGQPTESIEQITPEAIQSWINIPLSPTRLNCALLPLETLKKGLKRLLKKT